MKELPPNATLSHYRIVSKIGAGGMGEVYLAEDTKLDRKVALKILPAELAANHDRMRRFVQEAKAAAALNHPNIAHVYEIGETEGTHFIAMEYIDGETLREKIHRDKAPLSKLLKYLNQVAEGLAKAHAAGIVHRDLKPDNVMITRDGYAKVLDFGLAKLVEPQGFGASDSGSSQIPTAVMQQHSTPGMVMGTIGYMSPEQASGRINEIDHRSDIFSFGCLLFEAATGQRAFEGKDVLDSLHKIVHAPTPQLKDANPLAPDDLQRVVRRCLAKEPERRYQSMKEAEAQFGAATSSGSLDPNGRMLCAMFYLLAAGRFDEATREMALAITQDPLNAFWRARQAWILLCGEMYDEAITEARKALEFDDTNYQARMMVALSLTFQGKLSEAREEAEDVFRLAPFDALGTGLLAGLLARAGERDRATQLITTITGSGAAPVGMMMYHLVCAEIDAAIDWYQKDIELRRPNAPMIAFAGFLRPLRANPRWPKIARMMNLPDRDVAREGAAS